MTVSLIVVHIVAFLSLSLLCGAVYIALRQERALVWLSVGLLFAGVELAVVVGSRGQPIAMATVTILVPAGYLCLGRTIQSLLGQRRRYPRLLGTIAALTAFNLLLLAAGAPPLFQKVMFEVACVLAISESILRLLHAPGRTPVDIAIITVLSAIASIYALRIPAFINQFDATISFTGIQNSPVTQWMLLAEAMLVVAGVFLLLAKIVADVIADYRIDSEHDDLTGLLNRRAFADQASRDQVDGAMILCDIDYFKQVNDRYGHAAGDAVIQVFAQLLMRTGYPAGRMGGEEFALMISGAPVAQALRVAERLRTQFHATRQSGQQLSASFGITRYAQGDLIGDILARADTALYAAKEAGRNRVALLDTTGDDAARPEIVRLQHAA